jgi:hypothetical protein
MADYNEQLDDTQPNAPFSDDILTPTINPEAEERGRGGCGFQFVIIAILLLFAIAIVALAGLAGWTNGQREGNRNLSATHSAAIDEQIRSVSDDVASANLVLLSARIQWLATQTPGVAALGDIMATGTALYMNNLPTVTPTVTPTFQPTATADSQQVAMPTPGEQGLDLAALFAQAQAAAATSVWTEAIDLLDVILATDPNFQSAQVRQLMSQSLNSYARELYNASQPAAANLIVARAEEFGPLAEGLAVEREAAELWLTASAGISTGSQTAVNALNQLLSYGPLGRYYDRATQLLYNGYVRRGDGLVAQGNPCGALSEYQQAMNVFSSGAANGKYSAAQASCAAMSAPTVDPNWMLTPGAVAPIGVPGT